MLASAEISPIQEHPEPRSIIPIVLKSSYDAVMSVGWSWIGSSILPGTGLWHAQHRRVERGYIGGGNTGRNTTIIRSNYLTPEGVRSYDESVR